VAKLTAITEAFYQVEIRDRETERTRCVFNEGEGNFERRKDGISQAEFTANIDLACMECECVPRPRLDELAIIRDDWPEPAWVGPITRIVDDPDTKSLKFNAEDRLFWWNGASASSDYIATVQEVDVVTLASELIRQSDKFSKKTLIDHRFQGSPKGLPPKAGLAVTAEILEGDSLWSQIDGLADSVLDYSMVGPHLYWGSPNIPISGGPRLTGKHWKNRPLVDRDASEVISQVRVTGQGGVVAVYPEKSTDIGYGHKTGYFADSNLNTVKEAADLAEKLYEANRRPTDFIVTGVGSLSSEFPLPLHELIPGRKFQVDLSGACLQASAELELFNLIVEFGSVAAPSQRLKELRVAADFAQPGALGAAERQSAAG